MTNAGGTSDPVAATMQTFLPGLFLFPQNYVAAVRADGVFLGPAPPAKPGDAVLLFGTGFGPTSPGVLAGEIFRAPPH